MRFALTVLIPTLLCAQNIEKTLTFQHSKTLEQAQEIAKALTTIGQVGAQARAPLAIRIAQSWRFWERCARISTVRGIVARRRMSTIVKVD